MSIDPVVHMIEVKVPPARTFDLFARQIGLWWPKGRTIGRSAHADIVIEPRAGGRWFERDADGRETQWGKVLAWEPPSRLLLGWQIRQQPTGWGYDPDLLSEVEVTFAPLDSGGTRVRLEHRNLERLGAGAAEMAAKIRGGWAERLAEFALFADALRSAH